MSTSLTVKLVSVIIACVKCNKIFNRRMFGQCEKNRHFRRTIEAPRERKLGVIDTSRTKPSILIFEWYLLIESVVIL